MSIFSKKYGDFSDLDDLVQLLASPADLVVSEGSYDAKQPHPGPHAQIMSARGGVGFDFIRQADGSFVLVVRR
jgi:hypothetical protein